MSTCVRRQLQLRTVEDFVGAKFYCLYALADGNQRIRIREKTLEFSPTVYTVSVGFALFSIVPVVSGRSMSLIVHNFTMHSTQLRRTVAYLLFLFQKRQFRNSSLGLCCFFSPTT